MKMSRSQPLHVQPSSVQPWLRDQYQTLRTGAGPRFVQARAVVVPVLTDASHKVRDEILPATVQFSSHVADEVVHRSAPLRAELSDRANAALAAARGQVTTAQIEHLKNGRGSHRRLWLIGGAAAAGAAIGTAAVLWQRARDQAWVEDDAVTDALSEKDAEAKQGDAVDRDDPSDPDGGAADPSSTSSGQHSNNR